MLDLVNLSLRHLLGDRRGISAIEYGVLGAVVVVAVAAFAGDFGTLFDTIMAKFTAAVPA